jgi:hypothetical protein
MAGYLRASVDFETMVDATHKSLKELEFEFFKNGTEEVAEFEITRPSYFRIVVEPNKIPKVRNIILPSISAPTGSTIDIRFDVDADRFSNEFSDSSANVRLFLRSLLKYLPYEPWRGLERNWGQEEKRWRNLMTD